MKYFSIKCWKCQKMKTVEFKYGNGYLIIRCKECGYAELVE